MLFTSKSDATLAIDLGPDAVRLIELRLRKAQLTITLSAQQALEDGPLATLPTRHLAALAALLGQHRLHTRSAIAAMPTNMVVTRTVQPDKANAGPGAPAGKSLEDHIRWTLQNCLPFDPRDLLFDYWPIHEANSGKPPEFMVVATQASVVEQYMRGFEKLKLTCAHLDVAPCALATLISHSVENSDAPVGTIALSQHLDFFAIAERGRVLFWRPFELPHPQDTDAGAQANLDRMGDEISKCVSHMVGAMHVDNLSEVLLYGCGSENLLVGEYLKNRFHIPVRSPSPLDALPVQARGDYASLADGRVGTHYCTAMGLAMKYAGGQHG